MLKKIFSTAVLLVCICVLPSYTNTCAKPDANFMKVVNEKDENCVVVEQPVRKAGHGLEVFPLELISIQL